MSGYMCSSTCPKPLPIENSNSGLDDFFNMGDELIMLQEKQKQDNVTCRLQQSVCPRNTFMTSIKRTSKRILL